MIDRRTFIGGVAATVFAPLLPVVGEPFGEPIGCECCMSCVPDSITMYVDTIHGPRYVYTAYPRDGALFLQYVESGGYKLLPTEIVAACLILEAGGEGRRGMIAVSNVIRNRGGEPALVVLKPTQFSCFNDIELHKAVEKAQEHPRWDEAVELAVGIEALDDITDGATHYHAARIKPYWADSMTRTKRIGNHIFYRENKR